MDSFYKMIPYIGIDTMVRDELSGVFMYPWCVIAKELLFKQFETNIYHFTLQDANIIVNMHFDDNLRTLSELYNTLHAHEQIA